MSAVLAAFFGVTAQLIFKNDGNMYRIPRGGRGAATARRLEYNRQNGGKLKIEAKKDVLSCCVFSILYSCKKNFKYLKDAFNSMI